MGGGAPLPGCHSPGWVVLVLEPRCTLSGCMFSLAGLLANPTCLALLTLVTTGVDLDTFRARTAPQLLTMLHQR